MKNKILASYFGVREFGRRLQQVIDENRSMVKIKRVLNQRVDKTTKTDELISFENALFIQILSLYNII